MYFFPPSICSVKNSNAKTKQSLVLFLIAGQIRRERENSSELLFTNCLGIYWKYQTDQYRNKIICNICDGGPCHWDETRWINEYMDYRNALSVYVMLPWRCSTMTCRILRVFTAKKLFPLTQTLKSSSCALITVSQITLLSSAFAVKAKANRPVCMLGWLCQKVIAAFCVLKSYKKWLGVLVKSM